MMKHSGPISGICTFGEDFVATAGYDNQVILWDARSQVPIARGCHDHLVNQCAFHPDGGLLATSSSDHSARLWSVPSMQLRAVLNGHSDDVEGLAFHPFRPVLATASRDGRVRLFDFDGKLIEELIGHTADVISLSWTPAGKLVSSSDDGTVRTWNVELGIEEAQLDCSGVETDTIAIAADGAIFAGNDLGEITLVDRDGTQVFEAHKAGIKKLCFSEASNTLVSLSYDRRVMFWRRERGGLTCVDQASLPAVVWPRSCEFLGAKKVVFVTFGSTYATYDLDRRAWHVEHVEPTHGVNAICMHRDRLLSVGDAGIVLDSGRELARLGSLCNFLLSFEGMLLAGGQMGQVIDALTGSVCYQHRSPLNCALVIQTGSGPLLGVGTYTGEMLLFSRCATGIEFLRSVPMHHNAIKGLASNGDSVLSVCATSAISLVHIGAWEAPREIPGAHDKIANGCASLPDGRYVTVSRDLKLRLWHGEDARTFGTPHKNSIKCCAVNPNSGLIATGDYTGHVGIFCVSSGGYAHFVRLTSSGISSIIPDPSGEGFLAASYDGQVYMAQLPSQARAA